LQNIVGILGLAVGFVCFALSYHNIGRRINTNSEYSGSKKIYSLDTEYRSNLIGNIYSLQEIFPDIERVTVCQSRAGKYMANVELDGKFTDNEIYMMDIDTCFIEIFSFKILSGNKHAIKYTSNGIVLFESKAKEFDENLQQLIGKTLQIGNAVYQVTGVLKRPENSTIVNCDGFFVNKTPNILRDEIYAKWDPTKWKAYIKFKTNVKKDFPQKLKAYKFNFEIIPQRVAQVERTMPASIEGKTSFMKMNRITDNNIKNVSSVTYLLIAVGFLIFLMALFNYLSFQIASFYNRFKECAIRKTNGAQKKHIFYLLFSEIMIALILTYIVSVFLLDIFYPLFDDSPPIPAVWSGFAESKFFRYSLLKGEMLKYLAIVLILALSMALLICLIPINIINRLNIRVVLFGGFRKGNRNVGRNILLFVQMIIMLLFMSASLIIGIQTHKISSKIFGNLSKEEKQEILYVPCISEILAKNRDVIMQNIKSSPLVTEALSLDESAIINNKIVMELNMGIHGHESVKIRILNISSDFFKFFNCKLLKGDFFDSNSLPGDVIVDETFASIYSDDPIGKICRNSLGTIEYRIVGVVKKFDITKNPDNSTEGILYQQENSILSSTMRASSSPQFHLYVKIEKGKKKEAFKYVRNCINEFVPSNYVVNIMTFEEEINEYLYAENRQFQTILMLFVASLIIGLSCIYSAIMMSAEKRRKEVAIRKIHGATFVDILWLLSKTYTILWTAACVITFPFIYYYGNVWLENYIDHISIGMSLFVSIYLFVLALIVLTIISQILKVARLNPAEIIKIA
jgi:ABC-type antimicrobial peptide transport system permease subunit